MFFYKFPVISIMPHCVIFIQVSMERLGTPFTDCSSDFADGNIFKDEFSHLVLEIGK